MSAAADRHREVAAGFTARVEGAAADAWDNPAPCPGWRARDVVGHLVEWPRPLLHHGAGVDLPECPSVEADPVGAWRAHAAAVQALLDDPGTSTRLLRNPHIGDLPLDVAIDRIYTTDVFLHTWDLARATGQDEHLDPDTCAGLLEGMRSMEQAMRTSGHYGPAVDVPEDADAQTRLLAFIGRAV